MALLEKKRPILEAQAKERIKAGKADPTANLPEGPKRGEVRDQLATEAGVSGKTYDALLKGMISPPTCASYSKNAIILG